MLFFPIAGLLLTTVLPLVYMILIAFTNYNMTHQPPGKLFDWVGLENFRIMLNSAEKLGYTFWKIFGWTIVWAVFATFSNYFLGMFLAMLINSKGIRFKSVWRTLFHLMLTKQNIDTWYTRFAAGAVLVSIPTAILFISLQKYFTASVAGSVKG